MVDELLIRKRQLALIAESTKGTYNTALDTDSTAKDNANFTLVDPSWSPSALSFPRNIRHPSLTPVADFFPGVASTPLTFGLELAGHSDNDGVLNFVEPPIGPALSACGFESLQVTQWTISSYDTGDTFDHGETVTGGASTETATVVGTTRSGLDTTIYLDTSSISGVFSSGETLTGGTSGTVATMSSVPNPITRWAWQPKSDSVDINTLSGVYYADGKRLKLKGMRGNPVFNCEHANRVVVTMTMQGIIEAYADGTLLTGANAPSVEHYDPPAFLGVNFRLDDQLGNGNSIWTPVFNALTVDMGNNVILRQDSNDADGWSFASISNRAPTGTANPDEVLDTTHPIYGNYRAGRPYQSRFSIGTSVGNIFEFRIPALQVSSLPESDREEITTWDLGFMLKGGSGASGALGIDNELVIINR